jgi:hypothetical protein
VLAIGGEPFDQLGSEISCPNGETALARDRQKLSGAPYAVKDLGTPTDFLDDLPQ